MTYQFVDWEPSQNRSFILEVPETSQSWLARYEAFILSLPQVIRPLSEEKTVSFQQIRAVLPPLLIADLIETVDAPPGPWVRLSGPGGGQSAVITHPLLGGFPLNVSSYVSSNGFDMSLQSVPLKLPVGANAGEEWISVTPSSLDMRYRRNDMFRMVAASGGMRLFGNSAPGTSHVTFELDPATGAYLAGVTLATDTPLIANICEFAAGSQLTVDTRNGVRFSFNGRLRMFRDSVSGWIYNQPYQFTSSFADFEFEVTDLIANSSLWSDGFLSMKTGSNNPRLFVRRNGGGYEAGIRNLVLGLFGESVTVSEVVASSDGLMEMQVEPLSIDFNNVIRLSTGSDSTLQYHALTGDYSLRLSAGKLEIIGNDDWPATGVDVPALTIDRPEFDLTFPFDAFNFAGLNLTGGDEQDVADSKRFFRLIGSSGQVRFVARGLEETAIGDLEVTIAADRYGLSASAIGDLSAPPIPPFINEEIHIVDGELFYDSEDDSLPF